MTRKIRKIIIIKIILVLIVLFLFGPLLVGVGIKRSYTNLLAFYNFQGNFHIQINSYTRGWFSSDVVLTIEAAQPLVRDLSEILGEQNSLTTQPVRFIVNQHIQHGPIVFNAHVRRYFSAELAELSSTIYATPDTAKFIQPINANDPLARTYDHVTFMGEYRTKFRSAGIQILSGDKNQVKMNKLEGRIWVRPKQRRVKGNMTTDDVLVTNPAFSLAFSNTIASFNRQQTESGIWIGSSSVILPEIDAQDTNGKKLTITDLNMQSSAEEMAGLVNGTRQIGMQKVQLDHQEIGPFSLKVSAHGLNAKALARLVAIYKQMLKSDNKVDFVDQFRSLFPALLSKVTTIKMDHLRVMTPKGGLLVAGKADWSAADAAALPLTLDEAVRTTNAQALLRISIPLTNALLHVAVGLSEVRHAASNAQHTALDKQKDITVAKRQNALLIAMLVQENQLSKEVGTKLLALQAGKIAPDVYFAKLQKLSSDNQISADVMETLHDQYIQIQLAAMPVEQRREFLEKQYQEKIAYWLRSGYISQEKNDYLVTMTYQQGVVKVNGHEMH